MLSASNGECGAQCMRSQGLESTGPLWNQLPPMCTHDTYTHIGGSRAWALQDILSLFHGLRRAMCSDMEQVGLHPQQPRRHFLLPWVDTLLPLKARVRTFRAVEDASCCCAADLERASCRVLGWGWDIHSHLAGPPSNLGGDRCSVCSRKPSPVHTHIDMPVYWKRQKASSEVTWTSEVQGLMQLHWMHQPCTGPVYAFMKFCTYHSLHNNNLWTKLLMNGKNMNQSESEHHEINRQYCTSILKGWIQHSKKAIKNMSWFFSKQLQ